MKYQTYIFDLDGTLINSLGDLAASTNHALRSSGYPERTTDEVRRFIGNGVHKLIERAVPTTATPDDISRVYNIFRQYYLAHGTDNTHPYDGIMEMLHELRRCGKKIAVVSNKFYDATKELTDFYFPNMLDAAIGENVHLRKKPNPDIVLEALRQMGVTNENAVYIGDSDVDIDTARNCGMPCVSVLCGYRDRRFLTEHGATTFAKAPEDILKI